MQKCINEFHEFGDFVCRPVGSGAGGNVEESRKRLVCKPRIRAFRTVAVTRVQIIQV